MENYESDIFMSQEGYASIDFTLLDRPNCNIASAPEATAALLPDVHVAESSFSSFDFLDGSGVDGLSGFSRGVDQNHSLELLRDDAEITRYKERTIHLSREVAGNGAAVPNLHQSQFQIPYAVQKPVSSSVNFLEKMPAKVLQQQQEQQSQLSLFNNEGRDENQDYLGSGQASQPSQAAAAAGSSWWMPETPWMTNNNHQDQSPQVFNQAATQDQGRLIPSLQTGSSQTNSPADYTGAVFSNSQLVNSNNPGPSMYSFLPTNTNQASDAARLNSAKVQTHQAAPTTTVKSLPRNSAYDFEGLLNGSDYQQQQGVTVLSNNMASPEQRFFGNAHQESAQDQQQNQTMNKYEGQQNMLEASALKVSDYDSFGDDYVIKGQGQGELGEQIEEEEAQVWRQQPSPQQSQLNHYGSSHEDMHQHHQQQAQVHQHLHQQQQQQSQHQLFSGNNQNHIQATGSQLQAFLSDNSLHDVPHQVVMQQPERAHPQIGLEHHHTLTQSGFQTVNNSNNNTRNVMYSGNDPSAAGQGPAIGYLLGQDNSFSWQQLAMKASGHDHPLYASSNSVKRDALGQALHPYASVQGNAMHGFYGGMGKLPAAASSHVNRPIPRSLGMGPSALFGIEGQSEVFNIGDQADIQARKIQASRAKLLFGQTVQQQRAPPHPVKNPQGFSRNLHQNMFLSANQQSMEELQSRHHHHHHHQQQQQQQSVRTNAAQQQGSTPQVKLFAQSLTPLNPMQQNLMGGNNGAAVQQHHEQAQAVTALQQSSFNVLQARNQTMGASPSNSYYQQASSHAAGGNFLLTGAAADNVKQQQMWNSYALEPEAASQIEVPMELMTAGTTSDGMVKSQWTTGLLETQACADMEEGALMSERLKPQQTLWSTHNNLQQSPGSVAELDSRAPSMQSSHCSSQQTVGGQASAEFDGKQLNSSDLQPNSLQPGTTMSSLMDVEHGRQQEMHSPHQEGSWHDHSLLQPRLQPPVAAPPNSSLEVFADIENPPQTNWKRAWRSVSDSEDTSELAEQQQQQNMIWGPSHQPNSSSHGGGSQSQMQLNPPDSRMSQSSWSVPQNSSQTEQLFPVANRQQQQWHNKTHQEQQILMPASPESGQVYHDVNGGHWPSNQVPNFPQGMRHPSQFMTDKDSTSASGQGAAALSAQEHGYYLGAYPQSNVSRDQRQNIVHNSVGSSSGSQDSLHYTNSSGEAHPPQQQGGGSNGWSHQIFRQSLDNPALSNMDLRQQRQQGPDDTSRVQLQLSNNQTENSFSALMKAKGAASLLQEDSSSAGAGSGMSGFKPLQPAGTAAATHRHQNQLQRMRMLNRMSDEALALWTQSQFAAGQMRMEQSMLVGKALESSGIIGKDYSTPLRSETTMEGTLHYPENVLAQRARLAGMHGATFKNSGLLSNVTDARTSSEPGMLSGNTLELLSKQEEDRRTVLQAEALKDQEAAMEANAVDALGISPAHLRQGTMGTLLQRPIPSHPESLSRELEFQLARNRDGWPQGRRLLNEYRQDSQAYGQQQQQQAATQSLHAGPLQSNVSHGDQSQGSQDRGDSGSMLFPAARLLPHDLSRQAAFIYKNLTPAARIQFASQFAQQFARASGTLQSFNPRSSAAQHLSRVGYDRASTSTWVNPVKPDTAAAPAPAAAGGQGGYKWPTEEQPRAPHVAEAAPITPPPPKKQKQEPRPFVPWRIAIRQAATHLPTISRSEIEWAAATNCLPEQDVFNEVGPEPSDVTALCMKRARRRLKLTTQLMQQLVPALPCRLFKGSTPEDQDNTVFLIAKFAVTEACLLATGVSKEQSAVTIRENRAPDDSSGNHTSEKMQQQTALVKNNIRPAMPDQLQIHLRHRMTQLNNELARMENAPSALKLARDCSDLDKLGVVTRLERFHPGILAEYRNSTGNVRAKQNANVEANLFSHSLRPFLERPISAVAPPTLLPENVLLRSL